MDLIVQMMCVYRHSGATSGHKLTNQPVEKRLAGNSKKRFWNMVCIGAQPASETGGQDKRFHSEGMRRIYFLIVSR